MLSGSTVLRISGLLIVAGLLAALVQLVWPHGDAAPEPAATGVEAPRTPEAREIPPAPVPPMPEPRPGSVAEPAAPPPVRPLPAEPIPTVVRPPEPPPPSGQQAVEQAEETTPPRAVALVSLNTGTLAELNRLRGGGSIGRAIIQKRPYASVGELLTKRVLSRATYDRIKDQVTVP
ncbi:ComEA family DNA-binding protein [Methylobacterium sp. A54F]